MNFRVSELTEIAFKIMGYQMYDRNGTPTNSLSQVIQPHLADALKPGQPVVNPDPPSCNSPDTQEAEEQFMDEYGLLDAATVLEEPDQYVDKQMASLLELLNARIMRTKLMTRYSKKAEAIRAQNAEDNETEVADFCNKLKESYTKAIYEIEVEIGATWSQTDQEIRKAYEAKEREQLEEFNMLLDLLKIILDDIPDNWRELDKIWHLLKTSKDVLKSIE
uniref:Uncharacterized protein n=1 Tax=Anopheles atroparvus TaxID=41427 RepID=A0A182IW53_ANOAO